MGEYPSPDVLLRLGVRKGLLGCPKFLVARVDPATASLLLGADTLLALARALARRRASPLASSGNEGPLDSGESGNDEEPHGS